MDRMGRTMKEHPIIFSSPMVRAILEGRKTQTRRVIKFEGVTENKLYETRDGDIVELISLCPYGEIGHCLWVRETFSEPYKLDIEKKVFTGFYRATDVDRKVKWRPSIFMPRWASRIDLEITGIRVERVQDISENDAIAEGVERQGVLWRGYGDDSMPVEFARTSFSLLWDAINVKRGSGWNANPWVWVIEFKRLDKSWKSSK